MAEGVTLATLKENPTSGLGGGGGQHLSRAMRDHEVSYLPAPTIKPVTIVGRLLSFSGEWITYHFKAQ
jgi:hypothetical protein